MRRPNSLAEVARRSMRTDAPLRHHLSEFLDAFYTTPGARAAMLAETPPLTGQPQTDAYLAGVAEHLALRNRLPVPGWVEAPSRFLDLPYYVGTPGPRLARLLLAESPIPFRRRMVFTEADPLRRATR